MMEPTSSPSGQLAEPLIKNSLETCSPNVQTTYEAVDNSGPTLISNLDVPQTTQASAAAPSSKYLQGYVDCAQEALRYLLHVEKLPVDHPLVTDIKSKLYDHYRLLQMNFMFGAGLSVGGGTPQFTVNNNMAPVFSQEEIQEIPAQAGGDDHVQYEKISECKTSDQVNGSLDQGRSERQCSDILAASGLSQDGQWLAARLAEEIFCLLSDDGDDSDDDSDWENTDEGFAEMEDSFGVDI